MNAAVLALLFAAFPPAQDTLHLAALQRAAVRQDPRGRQLELRRAITDLRIRSLAAERLPQVRVGLEASHQSEVPAIPIRLPGVSVPAPPMERWEAALELDWLWFDAGALAGARRLERAALDVAAAELAERLHPLRLEVTEAFFGALLVQERLRETAVLVEDLEARLSEARAAVRAGAALPGDTAALTAELLRTLQRAEELEADRRAQLAILRELTGAVRGEGAVLALPDLADRVARVRAGGPERPQGAAPADAVRAHPGYAVLSAERDRLRRQMELAGSAGRPRVSVFGRLAYGTPGLEQFTDDPHAYWVAGVRLRWLPWDWGGTRREREALGLRQRIVATEEGALYERLRRRVEPPLRTMERLEATLDTDARIVRLREQVERQARAQLAERAITAAAWVEARNDVQEARLALRRHRVELAYARAAYLNTLGVELR